jgi:hypothetical protein
MDREEMSNCNSGLSIDASYQVSLPLAEGFQRRRYLVGSILGRFSKKVAHLVPNR